MINVDELKRIMAEKNVSNEELSRKLNINKTTLYRKLKKNGAKFSVEEAQTIKKVLKLTKKQAINIFFNS